MACFRRLISHHAALRGFTIVALLCHAGSSSAQLGTGSLTGKLIDADTRKPLADVVVTATSAALQGEQTVVSDASGAFLVPSLPPGEYTLRYEADGYRPYARSGIQLRASVMLRVDAELLPETIKAKEVTVVARPPTVDVGSTRTGVTVTNEFTNRIAVAPPGGKGGAARSFEQLAEVAPGVRTDTYGASVAGTTSIENQYLVDGLSVNDPAFGYNGMPLSIEFIKETNIVTGGYLPEYGRGGGGVLDVVTKSGSNEFRATLFGFTTPWQAAPKIAPPQNAISTFARIDSVRDIGFDLGGPIVRDKVWFYVGADLARQSFELTRDLNALRVGPDGKYVYDADGLIMSDRIAGTRRLALAEQTGLQYIGKLTFSPGDDDRFELIHRGTPTRSGGDGNYSIDYETGAPLIWGNPGRLIIGDYGSTAWRQEFDAFDTSLKWTHSGLNKRLTFDTIIGWHHQHTANLDANGELGGAGLSGIPMFLFARTNPAPHSITDFETLPDPSVCANPVMGGDARCPVALYAVGGPQILQDRWLNRYQLRETATLVAQGLGHHVVKAGAELEYMTYGKERAYPGGVFYQETANGMNVRDSRRFGGLTGPDQAYTIDVLTYDVETLNVGAFVQDSWSILDVITLNAGFRYDTQWMFAEQGKGLVLPNQWSPRVGVIFDPTQRGRAKVFANYAIYYQTFPLNIMDRAGSGEPQVVSRRPLSRCNPLANGGYPQSCEDPAGLISLNGTTGPNDKWAYLLTGRLAVDPDIRPQSSSEFSAGGEYEVIPSGRVGVTYIRRWMNNVIEDMSRDEGTTFFLGNPGRGIASDFPEAERTYDAAILSFTKTFSDYWLTQASYTLAHLRGNWSGFFSNTQLDPGTNADFDSQVLLTNSYGPLPGDRRHEIKLFGARDIPFGPMHHLTVGASYRARSGAPTNYMAAHPTYGNGYVYLLPRGSGERLPWLHTIDLHLGYAFLHTKHQTLSITADIFNVLNFRAVTARSQNYTYRPVQPITGDAADAPFVDGNQKHIDPSLIKPADGDPRPFSDADKDRSFGAPLEYQAPFTVRFGVKSTF